MFSTPQNLQNTQRKYTYMFRLDVANHVVGTVQGVTESVLVGSPMQTFNHTWKRQKKDHNELQYLDVYTAGAPA